MSADFHFVECTNDKCRLRFPLDLNAFEGKYCPRCGSGLRVATVSAPGLPAELPSDYSRVPMLGLLDNIRSSHNVGSIFRSADGAGFAHLYLCGITPTPARNPEIGKTALGAEKSLTWSYHPNAHDLAKQLKTEGRKLIALERATQSMPIQEFHPSSQQACVLIVGNEPAGVDPELLELADQVVSLPMLGTKESLNVSISFSIAAYWLRLTT